MLKALVRKRLIAAADEIFGLFERTIASYEEQLCRAREENEGQRRQLQEVCSKTRIEDSEPRSPRINEQEVAPRSPQIKEEEDETDISRLPLNVVVVKTEDEDDELPESSQHHLRIPSGDHHGGPQPDTRLAPLSDSDDIEESLRSNADCGDSDLQPPYVKEEEEDVDVSKLPLTVISVKSEDDEDEAPESSQVPQRSPSGDHHGGPPAGDNLLAPLSHSDDTEESSRSDTDCEGDKEHMPVSIVILSVYISGSQPSIDFKGFGESVSGVWRRTSHMQCTVRPCFRASTRKSLFTPAFSRLAARH
ncbi:uncharacterized protein LOC133474802 isoform X3 [Phyllopteryx taeniolatus]|uniref:uncharacterized protein LOC133474802 isoform X3 n=1 Tax=Phyllopteryx taeniolatus TaxID=161469 RepID=UPI002AD511F0|nr:uncharacterized protein LOC133474802 isoform X3 [Phyllopteryx taeniolatus]